MRIPIRFLLPKTGLKECLTSSFKSPALIIPIARKTGKGAKLLSIPGAVKASRVCPSSRPIVIPTCSKEKSYRCQCMLIEQRCLRMKVTLLSEAANVGDNIIYFGITRGIPCSSNRQSSLIVLNCLIPVVLISVNISQIDEELNFAIIITRFMNKVKAILIMSNSLIPNPSCRRTRPRFIWSWLIGKSYKETLISSTCR